MSIDIKVPELGESVTEATIGQWLKKVGDAVAVDEPLVELETDKVALEVPSPVAGVLESIVANTDDNVEVGALIATIAEGAVAAQPAPAETAAPQAAIETTPVEVKPIPVASVVAPGAASAMSPSPSAQKMLNEKNVPVADISGSGKRGQVLKEDVMAAIEKISASGAQAAPVGAPRPPAQVDDVVREERVKITRLRQTIARRLKDAQNSAAMLTTFNEVDMGPIMELRKQYKELFEKKHGVKLGFMGFFCKAITHALKEIPNVNAEIDGNEIIYKNYAHIGVAVGTDRGLVVRCRPDVDCPDRAGNRPAGAGGARWQAGNGRHARGHFHHFQWWGLRLLDVNANS